MGVSRHDEYVCSAAAVAIALDELERMKALVQLPTPEALLERLQMRGVDFNLVAGVALAYLRNMEVAGG